MNVPSEVKMQALLAKLATDGEPSNDMRKNLNSFNTVTPVYPLKPIQRNNCQKNIPICSTQELLNNMGMMLIIAV